MKSEPSSFYFLKKPDRPPVQIKKTSNTSETKLSVPLSLIQYNNPFDEIEYLSTSIRARGHIPIVWSKARGLMVNHLSRAYPLFDGVNVAGLNDPLEVIKFIISKPQECISYIFEDFHHYIGEKDTINPVVGEIRSLIKELYRNLTGRNESVFLFVPRSYELPPELQPFFAQSIPKSLKKNQRIPGSLWHAFNRCRISFAHKAHDRCGYSDRAAASGIIPDGDEQPPAGRPPRRGENRCG